MVKKIIKNVLIIMLLTILVQMVISSNNHCLALGDVTSGSNWLDWEPTINGEGELTYRANEILAVISVLGVIISIITLSVIGIKIMLGSVEEKANYKQTLKPWLIGATMVFAVTTIPTIVYNITDSLIKNDYNYTYSNTAESYNKGWDDAMTWVMSNYTIIPVKGKGSQWPVMSGEDLFGELETQGNNYKNRQDTYSKGYYKMLNTMDRLNRQINKDGTLDSAFWYWYAEGSNETSKEIEKGIIDSTNYLSYRAEAINTYNSYGITNLGTIMDVAKARGRYDRLNNYNWGD